MMIDFELSGNIERIYMLKGHIVSNLQLILAELCVRTNCAELIRLQFLPIFQLNFYALSFNRHYFNHFLKHNHLIECLCVRATGIWLL